MDAKGSLDGSQDAQDRAQAREKKNAREHEAYKLEGRHDELKGYSAAALIGLLASPVRTLASSGRITAEAVTLGLELQRELDKLDPANPQE